MSEPDVPGLNQDNAIPPSSFKITGAGGVSARVCISDMSQPCADNGSQGDTSLSHGLSTDGHHLIITGSVVARNHSVVRLNHDQMQTIAFAMLDGIRSLRDGWLIYSDLQARRCLHEEIKDHDDVPLIHSSQSLHTNAVVVTLVPCSTRDDHATIRRIRVFLEWTDSRDDTTWPLTVLFQRPRLPPSLLDLVQQVIFRLLQETLLKTPSSAALFHRSWRGRQRDVEPFIGNIASSLRSLISNAAPSAHLDALLVRLDLTQSLPSIITIQNLLHQFDCAVYSPTERPSASSSQIRRARIDGFDDEGLLHDTEDEEDNLPWPEGHAGKLDFLLSSSDEEDGELPWVNVKDDLPEPHTCVRDAAICEAGDDALNGLALSIADSPSDCEILEFGDRFEELPGEASDPFTFFSRSEMDHIEEKCWQIWQ